ncbi:four helix bundle protein [Marinilabilia salmonicolor]|jgi:four helix bundle protein|uniref:Four helix bundle protein n=2 Tax=Marinilabilia salmonicolor TaxID=989 RepID=A0A2T0WXE1_9BACT|nr:four helix bundle protein [Marinilabilia salmonicolor]RCW39019.1 four helix bundle protein [Marinilabilia salmonicolor]
MIKSYKDLTVYNRSFKAAMDIYWMTRNFPKEEIYSLTSQIVRSSRSISSNILEGWAKRTYDLVFKQHLINSLGSCSETETWLNFALECQYINNETYNRFIIELDQIGKMLNKLHQNWTNNEKRNT